MSVASSFVDGALHPFDSGQINPEIMLHQAADEDCGGLGVKRNADTLAGQFLGYIHAAAVHDNKAMTKDPGREYRQRHEGQLLSGEAADIFRARHLADIEFQPVGHPIEDLPRIIKDDKI